MKCRDYETQQLQSLRPLVCAYFEYDGLSRRVKLTERDQTGLNTLAERRFGWEGTAIAEERDASDTVKKRFWGLGETRYVTINNQPSTLKLTYTRDHLGSIREVLDETCAIRARYAYDEWGARTKVEGNLECDFGFTGHFEHAASGITLALYRGYDARIGRWLSRDPIGEAGGWNLYGYVNGEPTISMDSFGLYITYRNMTSRQKADFDRAFATGWNRSETFRREFNKALASEKQIEIGPTEPLRPVTGDGANTYGYPDCYQNGQVMAKIGLSDPAFGNPGVIGHELQHANEITNPGIADPAAVGAFDERDPINEDPFSKDIAKENRGRRVENKINREIYGPGHRPNQVNSRGHVLPEYRR